MGAFYCVFFLMHPANPNFARYGRRPAVQKNLLTTLDTVEWCIAVWTTQSLCVRGFGRSLVRGGTL